MARVLAIDYGDRHIGLALGDTKDRVIAPLEVLSSGALDDTLPQLESIIRENRVDEVVLGCPLSLKGEETDQTRRVKEFAKVLMQRIQLPVILEDERLTSAMAKRQRGSFLGSLFGSTPKDAIQKTSAILILETYLEKKQREESEIRVQ